MRAPGEELRDAALARVEAGAAGWCATLLSLVAAMPVGAEFTTDLLWSMAVDVPERRAMGAVMKQASRLGLVERVGFEVSKRPECHARPVARWRRT